MIKRSPGPSSELVTRDDEAEGCSAQEVNASRPHTRSDAIGPRPVPLILLNIHEIGCATCDHAKLYAHHKRWLEESYPDGCAERLDLKRKIATAELWFVGYLKLSKDELKAASSPACCKPIRAVPAEQETPRRLGRLGQGGTQGRRAISKK